MNCRNECHHNLIDYRTSPSAAGETVNPDLSRRQFVVAAVSGITTIPVLRLNGYLDANWNPQLVRPPGALDEESFLSRCIKCGQCMRVCPTNVIHPAVWDAGLEGLWTPVLNFRIGTSGCQYKCIACGNICPTAAIRPISLDERLGRNRFSAAGPVRIGTAFVDRGRCLPWAMDTPCIVCQENCPVSPKAIITREVFSPVHFPRQLTVRHADSRQIELDENVLATGRFATGDFFCTIVDETDWPLRRITQNSDKSLLLTPEPVWDIPPVPGNEVEIRIRLQRPEVKPEECIGCGVCEHECPVRGRRAIRVTAENETRNREHKMLIRT
jgi:ferredoxin